MDQSSESHRRLEITAVNGPAILRKEITHNLQQANEHGSERNEVVLEELTARLLALVKDGDKSPREMVIIERWLFDTIFERQSRRTEAHRGTYDWIFDKTKDRAPGCTGVSLLEWLRTGSGVYWVSGKAGSGKSTLIRYLQTSENMTAELRVWAGEKWLVTAAFFFWSPGTNMQKSKQGLLQTLLYSILRQFPALVPLICTSSRWNDVDTNLRGSLWQCQELLDAFSRLGTQSLNSKFCFLVDGLDDYDGDHEELVTILKELVLNDIKVLFSSRPWTVFEKAYGENFGQKLELQSLTRSDIILFVTETLCEDRNFRELKATDLRYDELVTKITDRPQGVFLWVFLVVRSLRRGLTNEDTIAELQKRLRISPTNLRQYFRRILDSAEDVYHEQAARLYL